MISGGLGNLHYSTEISSYSCLYISILLIVFFFLKKREKKKEGEEFLEEFVKGNDSPLLKKCEGTFTCSTF